MANFAIFESGKEPRYVESVDGAEFFTSIPPTKQQAQDYAKPGVIVNPDLSNVLNVPRKFWKQVGNTIQEMSQAEKDVITAAELQARKNTADNYGADLKTTLTALIKVINIRLSVGQKITKQEMVDALRGEIV